MRNLEVFAVAVLCGLTLSCARRVTAPAHAPAPIGRPETKARHHDMQTGRQAMTIISRARQRLAIRAFRVAARARPERHPEPRVPLPLSPPLPPASPLRRNPPQAPPAAAQARPRPAVEALIPPPPEPAEPTFPPASPAAAAPTEVPPEAAIPPPPEPAEPSFPATALMPPPPEPAEPALPTQDETSAENEVSVPFLEPPAYLSLRARPDWADIVGSIGPPRRPLPGASDDADERAVPRLIRTPWPLSDE